MGGEGGGGGRGEKREKWGRDRVWGERGRGGEGKGGLLSVPAFRAARQNRDIKY